MEIKSLAFFLSEIKLKCYEWETLKEKLKFQNVLAVSCYGDGKKRSEGLTLVWLENIDQEVQSYSSNYVDVKVNNFIDGGWHFTGLYGSPEDDNKQKIGSLLNLEDLGFIGHDVTWLNNRGGENNIQERLDRLLANGSFVTHLRKRKSDHLPIPLSTSGPLKVRKERRKKKVFRSDIETKFQYTTNDLNSWSTHTFGKSGKELIKCKN
ncbi:Pentafunctional AROM polypeptide 2 [Bienertia sinuspersici]